jgi:putative transposase
MTGAVMALLWSRNWKERDMPRLPRRLQWAREACYHLIDRGHDRAPIFTDDEDRRAFLDLIARYADRFGFRLYHYGLMTNHVHLLVHLRDPRQLSMLMAGLLRVYVHHCHRRHGFVGHRFQGRFTSPAVQCEGYLLSCGRYIERNPLEAGLVARPWDYAWSSARHYARGVPEPLVSANPYHLELSPSPKRRQKLWREFVLADDPHEEAFRRADWTVGDDTFRRRACLEMGRPAPRPRGRPRKSEAPQVQTTMQTIGIKGVV